MLRKLHLLVFLGLVVVAVLPFGLTAAGAAPVNGTRSEGGEGGGAREKLAGLRMETGAAYEAHGNAVFQLGELDVRIKAATEDLIVAEEDLGEAQGRLEDRASRMYKSGNVGFIDVLVGAESFNEFANRLELWVRLLARERAEFDRVREIRDGMAQRKAELEAARVQRVAAVEEADGQLDRTAEFEAEARAYLDSLDAETREAVETEQERGAEQARAEGDRIRREIAGAAPEPELAPETKPAPEPEPAVETKPVTKARPVTEPEPSVVVALDVEAESNVEAPPVAEVSEEVPALEAAAAPVEVAAVNLAAQKKAEREGAIAARKAAEVRAAEQAAAERYAADKAAAAEEARLAAERALAEQTAAEVREARQAAAQEAERRARLAARRAEAQQLAAEQAAFQQAEAERLAAERAATEQEEAASGEEGAQEVRQPGQYGGAAGGAGTEDVEGGASGVAGEQYGDAGSGERQYADGPEPTTGAQPAASAASPAPAASGVPAAPAASGSVSGEAVVAEAAKYMGVPYVLNAASPSAMDCSGLTMLAYGAFGISLPDPPVAQYGVGVPVYGPPQAGDLVFYNEYGDGISHVAIATGRGTIIHASSYAGYVTESPIDAPAGRLPEARRVL